MRYDLRITDMFGVDEIEDAKEMYDTSSREGQLDFIDALRNGERSAIVLFMVQHEGMLQKVFHKNVTGSVGKFKAARIADGEWEEFLGNTYMDLMDGQMFKSFDPEKFDDKTDLMQKVNWWVMQYLKGYAIRRNKETMKGGVEGHHGSVDSGTVTSLEGSMEDNHKFEGDHLHYEDDGDIDFINRFEDLMKDPVMNVKKKGLSLKMILKYIIEGKSNKLNDLLKDLGLSKVTFYSRQEQLAKILKEYDITGDDLMKAIKTLGNDRLAKMMREGTNELLQGLLKLLD